MIRPRPWCAIIQAAIAASDCKGTTMPRRGGASTPDRCLHAPWPADRLSRPLPRKAAPMRPCASNRRSTSLSWIPSEAVNGHDQAPVRDGRGPLRRPPRRRCSRTSRPCARPTASASPTSSGPGSRSRTARSSGYGQAGGGHDRLDHDAARLEVDDVRRPSRCPTSGPSPRSATAGCASRRRPAAAPACPHPAASASPPFVQVTAPLAWSTLALTIHADGAAEHELVGASPFPRHWVYGDDGKLAAKSGLIDFKTWYRKAFGKHSPWGDEDSPALVTEVETALERHAVRAGDEGRGEAQDPQGQGRASSSSSRATHGDELFLLLDGVLAVEVDGEPLAELGPGRPARRAGRARRRAAHVHAAGRDPLQGGGARRATGSTRLCWPRWQKATGGRSSRPDGAPLLRGPGVDPGPGAGVRPIRRQHLVRGHRGRRRAALASCSTRAPGVPPARRTDGREQPFRGAILLGHLHWDHTHGLPFFAGARPPRRRRSSCGCPRS